MKEPIKIGTIDSWENNRRIYIRWELTNLCNFNCSYCSHKESEIYKNVVLPKTELLLKAVNNLSSYQEPIHIDLFGGEATLVPGYLDVVESILLKLPNADIDTVSNASKSIEWFKEFIERFKQYANRISFTFSFHIEFIKLNEYIEKINILRNNGFNVFITFVVFNERFEEAKQAFYYIKEHSNPTQIYLKYLYGALDNNLYTEEQLNWIDSNNKLEKIFKIEFSDNTIDYFTINDMKKNWKNFNGWKCKKNHTWVITQTGMLRNACEYPTKTIDLKNNIFLMKDVTVLLGTKDDTFVCTRNDCDCLDDIAILKWKY